MTAVYPRVCGGTPYSASNSMARAGLSPRVRGNRVTVGSGVGVGRSIPACAGEPVRPWRSAALDKVYPRVCGGTYPASHSADSH